MNKPHLSSIRAAVRDYAFRYADGGGALHPMMRLKLEHSARVAAEARGLAADLGWDAGRANAAEALGWLHDVARFPQFHEFRTFRDAQSFPHAERGERIVREEGWLDGADAEEGEAILAGVRWHSAFLVPADIAGTALSFVRLVRDADKLDIYHIADDAIRFRKFDDYPEILLNVALDGPPNPDLVAEVRAGRQGAHRHIRSLVDMQIILLAWVNDLNFAPSFRRLLERRTLERLGELIPAAAGVGDLVERALETARRKAGASDWSD